MANKHTIENRYRAAAALIATGNSKAASRESGIPASTIRHWAHNDDDFQMMCLEIRTEFGEKIKHQLAEIIHESANETLDRVINGDVIRDTKTGELVRVPIKGRDLAIIGGVAFDKLRLAESQPTAIVQHENSEDSIKRFTEKFEAIAGAYQRGDTAEYNRLVRPFRDTALPMPTKDEDS